VHKSHCNPDIKTIYKDFLGKPLGNISHKLLHTHYSLRKPKGIATDLKNRVNLFTKK